eukprot:7621080-Alexandrium_andersonii.AAC.1
MCIRDRSSGGRSALNKVATLEEAERTAEAANEPRVVPQCEHCGTEATPPYLCLLYTSPSPRD